MPGGGGSFGACGAGLLGAFFFWLPWVLLLVPFWVGLSLPGSGALGWGLCLGAWCLVLFFSLLAWCLISRPRYGNATFLRVDGWVCTRGRGGK